jgi:uncharacterized protein GlcG (DUF336 family)
MDLLKLSKQLSTLVEEEGLRIGVPVTVSVVDIHGNIVLKHRMQGAPVLSLEMSERKAYTSALLRMRTAELTPLVQPGQPLYTLTSVAGRRFAAFGGGIPIHQKKEVVAGFGVSGGTTERKRLFILI